MVSVRIPTPLRKLSGDRDELSIDASTVSALIEKLESECPGMKSRLCDENGEVRRFINLYVNEEDIRFLDGVSTKLNDGDAISIIPAIAGG
ncbi:MAG: MoaD/ThiS family protein [Candidatus Dadabacteria bacterium]|nr:MoaD/ThiS family protein [Candidatus Dadabacteria bacterium]